MRIYRPSLSRHQNAGQNHDVTDGLKMWRSSDIWERQQMKTDSGGN
jgi:hypothetical protein